MAEIEHRREPDGSFEKCMREVEEVNGYGAFFSFAQQELHQE